MKIALINCFSGNVMSPDAPPYGLLYIGSALERAGYQVCVYDRHLNSKQDVSSFVCNILEEEFDVLGLGGIASAYKDAIEIASCFKKSAPQKKIIVGGYLGSTAKALLKKANIEAVVLGEGEISTIKLLRALSNGEPLEDVPCIAFLRQWGDIYHSTRKPNRKS